MVDAVDRIFFFQAEDGIRDLTVNGVQTCALPISLQALGKGPMTGSMIIWFVIFDFLFGIFLVWFYAAIRPRFGAGPRTAVLAGFAIWVLYGLLHTIGEAPMGLFPLRLAVIGCIVALVEYVVAAVIGAKYYTEM